jgi:hypothetical protein
MMMMAVMKVSVKMICLRRARLTSFLLYIYVS